MTLANLRTMFDRADADDYAEGCLAYQRYNIVMSQLAAKYDMPLDRVTAAFCALSPNNDYVGNLRSLVTLLHACRFDKDPYTQTISTYRHCRDRAILYLTGERSFEATVKGKKIRAFYFNILNPFDPIPVTVDGHISAAWQGKALTMREAIIKPKLYEVVADDVRTLARQCGLIGNQVQAIIWFARKRTMRIKYDPQLDLLRDTSDKWRTLYEIDQLRPYTERTGQHG